MCRAYLIALISFLVLLTTVKGLQVIEPMGIAGYYQSALITFADPSRLDFEPITGRVQHIHPQTNCEIGEVLSTNFFAVAWVIESEILANCDEKLEIFYQKLELANFTSVVVDSVSFLISGSALGYPRGMNTSIFSIPVTYVTSIETNTLSPYFNADLLISLDNDRGSFYRFSVNAGFRFYQYGCASVYLLVGLTAAFLLVVEIYYEGFSFNNFFAVTACAAVCGIIRFVKMCLEEHQDYYLEEPRPLYQDVMSPILFWLPLVVGTTAYSFTALTWMSTVSSIERMPLIAKIQKPLKIFFILLIPTCVVLPLVTITLEFVSFFILSALLATIGLFESSVFGIFGFKLLRHMSKSSSVLNHNRKSELEKKIAKFVMICVICWLGVLFVSFSYSLVGVRSMNTPYSFFSLSVMRDFFILTLVVVILVILKKRNIVTTKASKSQSEEIGQVGSFSIN